MTVEGTTGAPVLPLWLLHEEDVDAWSAAQEAPVAAWLGEHHFKGEKHRVLLRARSRRRRLHGASAGLGRRQGALSLWHAAGFVDRLPPRRFRLAQRVQRRRGHPTRARASPTAATASSAIARRPRRSARPVDRAAGECRPGLRQAGGRVARHGARLDQYAGLGSRARRTRGRRTRARRAAPARLSGMGGGGAASARISRRSMRWDARAPRRRAWPRSPGRRPARGAAPAR